MTGQQIGILIGGIAVTAESIAILAAVAAGLCAVGIAGL